MISIRTQNRLSSLISTIAEAEKRTEVVRQVLSEQKQFEPHTAFRRIDIGRDGYISLGELQEFLDDNQINASSSEISHIFQQLDFNNDGLISYNDFISSILPQEDQRLKTVATLRDSQYLAVGQKLPYEVEWGLSRIFEQQIKNFRKIQQSRDILNSSFDFDPLKCFNAIDEELNGYIDIESIDLFMRASQKVISEEEILAFIRLLGGEDLGRITYSQFSSAIQIDKPISKKINLQESRSNRFRYSSPRAERIKIENEYYENLSRSIEKERILNEIEESRRSQDRSRILSQLEESKRLQYRLQLQNEIEDLKAQKEFDRLRIRSEIEEQEIRNLERSRILAEQGRIRFLEEERREIEKSIIRNEILETQKKVLEKSIERSRIIQDIEDQDRYNNFIESRSRSQKKVNFKNSYNTPSKSYTSPLRDTQYKSAFKQQSPMKGNEEEHLVLALKEQINIDRDIEDIKKSLALKTDFNLMDAFKILDLNGKGYVSKLDLELSFNEIGIFPSKEELYLFFKRHDQDLDGLLRYGEFCKAILPLTSEYANLMNNRSPQKTLRNKEGLNIFEYETRYIYKKLINKLIQGEIEAESLRQKLSRRPLFSIHDAFNAIDSTEKSFITMDEFRRILNDYGFFVSSNDLISLVKRYDRNQDGKVSYGEFLQEMTPKSPQKF